MNDNYFRPDGSVNYFPKLLSCMQGVLYFFLKSKFEDIGDPYEVFIQDTNFTLMQNKDGSIYEIDFLKSWDYNQVFFLDYRKGKGMEALKEIEYLLDGGEIVLFQTFFPRVPFFKFFVSIDAQYCEEKEQPEHIFVAIKHDKEYIYYLEAPWLINNNFLSYNGSKTVGKVKKKDLESAFECFLNYYSITVFEEGLYKSLEGGLIKAYIKDILEQFNRPSQIQNSIVNTYNAEGVKKLIEMSHQGAYQFKDRIQNEKYELYMCVYNLFEWKFENIRQRNWILQECIRRHPELFQSPFYDKVLNTMSQTIIPLAHILGKLRKMSKTDRFEHPSCMVKYFQSFIEKQESLIYNLNDLIYVNKC